MVAVSFAMHVSVVLLFLLAPGTWGHDDKPPATLMTISLGGAPGPAAGGVNPMGGRAIQRAVPEPPSRPEPLRPPAARTPEMAMPAPDSKPARTVKEPPPAVKEAPRDARGQTLSTGEQEQFGSTVADTGGVGFGTGISTGGGGMGGYLDVGDFCCPDYLSLMTRLVTRAWNQRQGVEGLVTLKFTIQRDGRLTQIEVERTSGYAALDLSAQRALLSVRQLPPLPPAFTGSSLTVHLNFKYQR